MKEEREMDHPKNIAPITVHLSVDEYDIDQIRSLMDEITEKTKEAKTLAGELASILDGLSVHANVRTE